MSRVLIPAVHLPHGREVFKTLSWRPSQFKKILKAYSERGLLGCTRDDILVLSHAPDGAYLRFLCERGLGTLNIIVCAANGNNLAEDILGSAKTLDAIRAVKPDRAEFYIHLEEEDAIAQAVGLGGTTMHPALTRMFNTVYFLIRLEEDLDLPSIPREQVRASRIEEPLSRLLETHNKLFVRGNESCGGSQAYILAGKNDLDTMRNTVSRNRTITRYFASPFLAVQESWNIQYTLFGDGECALYGASMQALDRGYAHAGNVGGLTPPDSVLAAAEKIANRLAEMGGKGIMGIDLMVCGGRVYAAEINARINTSTPVLEVQKKIGARYFRAFKVHVPRLFTFADFVRRVGPGSLLDPEKKCGALPFHFKASEMTGVLDVAIFAQTEPQLDEIFAGITNALAG